jgi:hypothetical protein
MVLKLLRDEDVLSQPEFEFSVSGYPASNLLTTRGQLNRQASLNTGPTLFSRNAMYV